MKSDPVLYWNAVSLETHRLDYAFDTGSDGKPTVPQQAGPTRTSRALAIAHLAMYDAWNTVNATGMAYMGNHANTPTMPPTSAAACR